MASTPGNGGTLSCNCDNSSAMSSGNNALIQGYCNQISSAGDLKTGGGSSAKRLAQLSHWGKRNDNGQTGTGFINLFIPSDEGLENQVDEWGFSKKETARDSILNTWKAFEDAQDWTSLNEEMRQTPLEWKHNFITNSKQARFNIHIIGNQIAFLSTYEKPLTVKGRFAWRNNSTHGYDIKKLPSRKDFLSGADYVVFIPFSFIFVIRHLVVYWMKNFSVFHDQYYN